MNARKDGRTERDTRVVIYMTRPDAEKLNDYARMLQFKSRSALIVSILERLIIGGFSIVSFFKVGSQFQKRAEEFASDQFEFDFNAFKEGLRPFPALSPEDDPNPSQVRAGLKEIREELQTTK